MPKRLFDCFLFFDELDLLEMRMLEHWNHVDWFVIVEAPVTFRGVPKPLHFQENAVRFKRFMHKVILITAADMPEGGSAWDREHHQRNAIRQVLAKAAPEDMVIVSDVDELIRRETLDFLRRNDGYFMLDMAMYQYFMNFCSAEERWTKPFAFTWALGSQVPDFNFIRTNQQRVLDGFGEVGWRIADAGWHFTYLGGPERIRNKLRAFSHDDGWHARMLQDGAIEAQLQAGYNVGGTWHQCVYQPVDERFPKVVLQNKEQLTKAGYIRDPYEALRALQVYSRGLHHGFGRLQKQLREVQAAYDARLVSSEDGAKQG